MRLMILYCLIVRYNYITHVKSRRRVEKYRDKEGRRKSEIKEAAMCFYRERGKAIKRNIKSIIFS
jgi:hypothetical protein